MAKKTAKKSVVSNHERTERTRELILQAAEGEFVANGLEGAKMETIAKAAGINKALVYRHFDKKETLFQRVLLRSYLAMRNAEVELKLSNNPVKALEQLCEFTMEYYAANPNLLVLVGIENLHRGENLRKVLPEELGISSLLGIVKSIIKRGQDEGQFRRGIDPVDLCLTILSLNWLMIANAYTIDITFGRRMLNPSARSRRLENIKEIVRSYVLRR